MNGVDSGNISLLVRFPGNSILKFFTKFLKMRGWRSYAWVLLSQNRLMGLSFYAGYLFDIA